MAELLTEFNATVATYVSELEQLHAKNTEERVFQPTFWLQHEDFTLARDVFIAASGSIGHEVTKFSLVYGKTPSQEEASSICKAMQKPCEQLVAATRVALFCGAGPSLAEEIILGALRVMKSVRDLGLVIASSDRARVPEITGRVWESCKAVTSTPKSNCIASKRSMLQCVSVLNDTIKELKEFLSEQESTSAEALDTVEDEDDFAFDSHLSDDERALFESGLRLLEMVVAVLKRGVLTLKNLTIEDSQQETITWTAKLDRGYKAVQEAVVDMGAALYPPVDVEELVSNVAAAERVGMAVLDDLQAQPELKETEAQALSHGRAAFEKQVNAVKTQIEAAQA
ncbi:hypothetical protein Poli38472_009031 [Pythium oligandrum]|uniref:Cyclin-D1-binding protein 1-like N-terminal domain-containing protein n=1 Tax=Pythium oligandrum TaxID=41045 RepID=A0A8K1CKR0_PYTOL|nr:hypothetical protein Poli38472_009031 [Pythium oligandrum]|eukprot:TMW64864.1 hypothetical protein Poli38472_009031 [Pythium oligandrum]